MAQSKDNIVTYGLSGLIGKLLVFRQRDGKTIVAKKPRHSGILTDTQKEVNQKFQQAVIYAKAAIADPATKEAYEEKTEPGQSAYNLAIADFFNAPDIVEILTGDYTGAVGSKIRVLVTDDFKVKEVFVNITNQDGTLVEEGNAVQEPDLLHWLYTATQTNNSIAGDKITVTATDVPVNLSVDEKVLP